MKIEKKKNSDLLKTYGLWNAWKPDFTFPLDEVDKKFLSNIYLDETCFCSTIMGEDFFNYELIVNELSKLINEYESAYLLAFGYDAIKKNKLRSYKGLTYNLKYKINGLNKYEHEFENGFSVLGAKINLKLTDNLSLDEVLFKMPNNYIILSKSIDFNVPFTELIKNTLSINENVVDLNFNRVLEYWFKTDKENVSEIVRIGGNGNSEVSIQRFRPVTSSL